MKYKMDRRGIGKMMRSDPAIHRQLLQAGNKVKAVARGRIRNQTGELANSGRVEDLGIQRVQRGEPRMTVAVVFHSRYAMDHEKRTGFLSGAVGRGRRP
jgi:hypothetical protein